VVQPTDVALLKLPQTQTQLKFSVSDSGVDLPVEENRPFDNDDLTSQELALRFKDVLAYFRSVPPGDPVTAHFTETYTPEMSLLRGRLDDLHLSRCTVLPSSIKAAGNGLYTTRNVGTGELITLYPGDAILLRDNEMAEVTGAIFGGQQQTRPSNSPSLTDDAARAYEIRASDKHAIVGDPCLINDTAYLGHIANDGAILTQGDDVSRTVYSRASADAANAAFQDVHEGCHFGLFATQPIPKGREIFVSYGEGYWLSRGTNEIYRESKIGDEKRQRHAAASGAATASSPATKTKNKKNTKGKKKQPPGRGF
jgi:hypothetical protein